MVWMDEEYKTLKLKKMEADLEEQKARIELLRAQKDESCKKLAFYEKATQALDKYMCQQFDSEENAIIVTLADPMVNTKS